MTNQNTIRAWKDAEYRSGLSDQERALLPANPAGSIELDDAKLAAATGGQLPLTSLVFACTVNRPGGDCYTTVHWTCERL